MHASSYSGFANDPANVEFDADGDCDGDCVDGVSSTILVAFAREPITTEAAAGFNSKFVVIGAAVGVAMANAIAAFCCKSRSKKYFIEEALL